MSALSNDQSISRPDPEERVQWDTAVLSEHVLPAQASAEQRSLLRHALSVGDAPILIVDDQPDNLRLLEANLKRGGFTNIHSTADPREVVRLVGEVEPHLILLDLNMPYLDGYAVMAQVQRVAPHQGFLPILVLTADPSSETRRRALYSGATDFLAKPFDMAEVRLRVANLLRTRRLYDTLLEQNEWLDELVRARTLELEESRLETLRSLALAAEYRDDVTGRHTQRVGELCAAIGRELGLPEAEVLRLQRAAPLHDLGKIGIPDAILLKRSRLTQAESERMKRHTHIGAEILADSRSATLVLARQIALAHHEHWDGTGYPRGLAGEQIPLAGRVVAVADAFDAMTHARLYKAAWPVPEALAEIERQRGRQFDPDVVDAFKRVIAARIR